jgi:hypothetical protein
MKLRNRVELFCSVHPSLFDECYYWAAFILTVNVRDRPVF